MDTSMANIGEKSIRGRQESIYLKSYEGIEVEVEVDRFERKSRNEIPCTRSSDLPKPI